MPSIIRTNFVKAKLPYQSYAALLSSTFFCFNTIDDNLTTALNHSILNYTLPLAMAVCRHYNIMPG